MVVEVPFGGLDEEVVIDCGADFAGKGEDSFFSLFNTSYQLVNGVEEVLTYHVGHMRSGQVGLEGVEDGVSGGLVRLFLVWDDGLNEQWDLWKRAA